MPYDVYDLNPADYATVGSVGEPGKRTFYIQARKGQRQITLRCEKAHLVLLIAGIEQILLIVAEGDLDTIPDPDPVLETGMALELPLDPVFHVGQINLGYDPVTERLVLIFYELLDEESKALPSVARFWITLPQARALAIRCKEVVEAGRPICVMCGEPIDPDGHFCPRKNGHKT